MTPAASNPGKGRILVVDDDRLVLATVTHGLTQAGYDVIDADNGDDAILLARQHRPQLALLDIRMEGKSGLDVAETLRDAYRIPFLFLSAFSDPATLAQVKALGALAYLVKPLDVGQIVPAVAAAFARLRAGELANESGTGLGTGLVTGLGTELATRLTGGPAELPAPTSWATSAPTFAPTSAPTSAPTLPASVAVPPATPLSDAVALAVGVLMHRHSLSRVQAWERLQRMALAQSHSPAAQAERLLDAVEELARSAL